MKRYYFLLLFLLINTLSFAQFPNWAWAKGNGTATEPNGFGNAITVTDANLIYCVGQFNSKVISFGSIVLANEDGDYENADIFLACYTNSGEVVWAKSMGGSGDDIGKSIASDKAGNVYITGGFTSAKIGFGKDTLYNVGEAGTNDVFIAKYNGKGEEIWAKAIGGANDDKANCVSVDKDGNVYITGSFISPKIILQKGDTLINKNDQSGSSSDIFILKYNSDGKLSWAKNINGYGRAYDYGYGIATDSHNNVYVAGGTYSNELHFDSITISNSAIDSKKEDSIRFSKTVYMLMAEKGEMQDTVGKKVTKDELKRMVAVLPPEKRKYEKIFIAKYSEPGKLQWAEMVGGSDDEEGSAIATDKNDNVFITGRFESTSMTLETTTLENQGTNDIYIAKYNTDGKTLWAKSVGGIADDRGNAIATDLSGNVYIAGWFASPKAIFGKCTQTNSGGKSYTDMFIAKYDTDGNALWAENAKGRDSEWCNGVSIGKEGNIYLTGGFDSPEMNFGNTKLMNGKKKSFFIGKINGK